MTYASCDHCGSHEPAGNFADTARWGLLCECCAGMPDEELAEVGS